MKKVAVLLGVVLLLASANVATAADEWKGFYIGAALGGANYTATWTDVDYDWFGGSLDLDKNGLMYGGVVGYNFQPDSVVYGIELDLNFSNIENNTRYSDDVDITDTLNGFYALKGRVGVPVGKALVYLSGGLAMVDAEHSWKEDGDPSDSWDSIDNTNMGYTFGFGVEHMLTDRMSIKFDYSQSKFAEEPDENDDGYTMRLGEHVDGLMVGLNWNLK